MSETVDLKEYFYASKYWQEGKGLQLWQTRLMLACLEQVGGYDLPKPFFTVLSNERTDEPYGYYASWEHYGEHTLTIEVENKELFICGFRMFTNPETGKTDFDDNISFGFGCEEEAENLPWSELPRAITETRKWVHERFKDYPSENEKSLMSLVRHLDVMK